MRPFPGVNHFVFVLFLCTVCGVHSVRRATRSSRGPRTPNDFFLANPRRTRFHFPTQKKSAVQATQRTLALGLHGTQFSFTRNPRIDSACDVGGCPNVLFCPSARTPKFWGHPDLLCLMHLQSQAFCTTCPPCLTRARWLRFICLSLPLFAASGTLCSHCGGR